MASRSAVRVLSRGYATASPTVRPPIMLNGLPGKYASSAYVAALSKDQKTLQKVDTDLQAIQKALKEDKTNKLQTFISNPTLSVKEKTAGLDQLINASGNKADPITRNLFEVLAENGRLQDTEKVIEGFAQLMSANRGEVEITVTSAAPLDKSLSSRLEKALKDSSIASNAGGKSLKITHKISPAIKGGLIVDFGDRSIDLSVSSKVNRLNQLLQESI